MIPTLFYPVILANIEFNSLQGPGLCCNSNVLIPIICYNPICCDTPPGPARDATTTVAPEVAKSTTTETTTSTQRIVYNSTIEATTSEAVSNTTRKATPQVTSNNVKTPPGQEQVIGVVHSSTIETTTSEAVSTTTTKSTPRAVSSTTRKPAPKVPGSAVKIPPVQGQVIENYGKCLLPREYRTELINLHTVERLALRRNPLIYDCMFERLAAQGLPHARQLGYSGIEVIGKYSNHLTQTIRNSFHDMIRTVDYRYRKMVDLLATKFGCYGKISGTDFVVTCVYDSKESIYGVKVPVPLPDFKGIKTAKSFSI